MALAKTATTITVVVEENGSLLHVSCVDLAGETLAQSTFRAQARIPALANLLENKLGWRRTEFLSEDDDEIDASGFLKRYKWFTAKKKQHAPAPGCNGTMFMTLKQGSGDEVTVGKKVTVHARGTFEQSGQKFWSTKDPGQQPLTYDAGRGLVIKGWDQGLLGAKRGEERELIIPAEDGYGCAGFPAWGIAPGSTLVFTLEVLDVQ